MLIPKMLYGTYKEVKARVRKIVPKLKAGASLAVAVEAREMLDTETTPGEIYLERPMPGRGTDAAFHPEALGEMVAEMLLDAEFEGKPEQSLNDPLFQEFLATPWGATAILGRSSAQDWLRGGERFQAYLEGVLQHKAVFEATGARFYAGAGSEQPWYAFPHGVVYATANLGATQEAVERFVETGETPQLKTLAK